MTAPAYMAEPAFAMLRAAWQWSANGRIVSGGSTLSMQVARVRLALMIFI